MVKNKKAWVRIVEAAIAVILLASFLVVVNLNQRKTESNQEYINQIALSIMREALYNFSVRNAIINYEQNPDIHNKTISSFLSYKLLIANNWLAYTYRICELNDPCTLPLESKPKEKEIYGNEILVSATYEQYNPKKFKVFMWIKN